MSSSFLVKLFGKNNWKVKETKEVSSVNKVNLSKTVYLILFSLIIILSTSSVEAVDQYLYGLNESCTDGIENCWIPVTVSANGSLMTDVNVSSVSWTSLIDVPASFADDIDNTGPSTWAQGTDTIYNDSSGIQVGIGTASPATTLEVYRDTEWPFTITRGSSEIDDLVSMAFRLNKSNNAFADAAYISSAWSDNTNGDLDSYLTFRTRKANTLTEHMRIDSTGNVGIGTASPTHTLDVYGTLNVTGASSVRGLIVNGSGDIGVGNSLSKPYTDEVAYTRKVRIGREDLTSNQQSTIQIGGYSSTNWIDIGSVEFFNERDDTIIGKISGFRGNAINDGGLGFYYNDDDNLYRGMTLSENGRLGIGTGTATPTEQLTVAGNMSANGTLYVIDGNVGIGTTTPVANLHIAGADATTQAVMLASDSTNDGWGIGLWSGWSGGSPNQPALIWSDGEDLRIGGGATNFDDGTGFEQYMVIKDGGNVGIGTTSPTAKLEVVGEVNISGNLLVKGDDGWDNNGDEASIDFGTNPGLLSLKYIYGSGFNLDAFTGHSINFSDGGVSNMIIDGSGNVGIGTTTPANTLHVSGDVNITTTTLPKLTLSDGSVLLTNPVDIGDGLYIEDFLDGGDFDAISLHNAGNNPDSDIHIEFLTRTDGSQNTGAIEFNAPSGNKPQFDFRLEGSSRMTILDTTRVGIGTTTPTHTLNVVGDINATGDIYKNGATALDWVFDEHFDGSSSEAPENYQFIPLSELKTYLEKNRHLPRLNKELYAGDQVEVGLLSELLLEKTEEQALYIIELNNALQQQQTQIEELKQENKRILKIIEGGQTNFDETL